MPRYDFETRYSSVPRYSRKIFLAPFKKKSFPLRKKCDGIFGLIPDFFMDSYKVMKYPEFSHNLILVLREVI